jgi:hypothetical protein
MMMMGTTSTVTVTSKPKVRFWPDASTSPWNYGCIFVYLVFFTFVSRPTSLLASIKVSVFLFMLSMLSPSRLTSSAYAKSRCDPFHFSPTWLSCTFLMAYSKAKLKSSRASPCFRPFWTGKLSDKCLPMRTLLYTSTHFNQLHGYLKTLWEYCTILPS